VAGRDEIYALGLRNPWRISFDRESGQLYAGDVGQGAMEEVDIIVKGGNYGWRVLEGSRCTGLGPASCTAPGFIGPITEYSHTVGRCSITGGYVYRGPISTLPAGTYVFGDFCTGEIFTFDGSTQQLLLDTNLSISSFGEDEAGEIYVVNLGGTISRLVNTVPLPAPTFQIGEAFVRRRSSGERLDPLIVKSNGKKYELVIRRVGLEASDADVYVNGRKMKTRFINNEVGEPILVARLRQSTLDEPGPLVIEARKPDGTRSNQITLQVLAADQ
jgi:hypothetical protein